MNRTFDIGDMKIGNITSVNYSTGYDYYEMKNNNYLSYDMAKVNPHTVTATMMYNIRIRQN